MTIAYLIEGKDKLRHADNGFSARLGFLGAATGQPHLVVPSQGIDRADIERYVARGRLLRASAIRNGFKLVTVRIAQNISLLLQNLKNRYRDRKDMQDLRALDDRMLKDIGVTRFEVESMALGVLRVSDFNARRGSISKTPAQTCKVYPFESAKFKGTDNRKVDHEVDSLNINIAA